MWLSTDRRGRLPQQQADNGIGSAIALREKRSDADHAPRPDDPVVKLRVPRVDAFLVEIVILLALVAGSLGLAWAGLWSALGVPALVALVGAAALLVAGPSPVGGGDEDPLRLIGGGLLAAALPWAAVLVAVTFFSRYLSRR